MTGTTPGNKPDMARAYFSPYAPRRRRSPQVVVVWVSMFAFILWLTWYITTRHKEYADEFMHPGSMARGQYGAGDDE